jgi:small subunit ribosomal protein S1
MSEKSPEISEFEAALQEDIGVGSARVGDVVLGTIVEIHGDIILIDIGGKSEAVLAREELEQPGMGDPVEVVVTAVGQQIEVSHRLAVEQKLKDVLIDAAETGAPVEGKVGGRRKGGFDVIIAGIRGFCPMSQIDDSRSDDLDVHLGQTYQFKVLEYDTEGGNLVVSRAALLRAEREALRAGAWERLQEGSVVEGTVRSLPDFGAFVDLGGVDGLVHVTEISHQRVSKPGDVLSIGEAVQVKILGMDQEKNRISLSIKQTQADPWDAFVEDLSVGGAFEGTVVRLADFGAFIQLAPGLDGLLHISQLPPGLDLKAEEFQVGQTINGWIKDIDRGAHRVGLTLRRLPDHDPWERIGMRYQEGQKVEGIVEHGTDFGVFVELEVGVSALIPMSETGLDRGADPREHFSPGQKVTAKVMSVDQSRQRISLSIKAQKRDEERGEYLAHMNTGSDSGPSVSGFAAQLMSALEKPKQVVEKKVAPIKEAPAKKKAPAKKPAAKKTAAKKTATAKKAPAKKVATKKAADSTEKKVVAKKAPAKKSATKKTAASSEKKTVAKKATTKKTATKKSSTEKADS